MNTQSSQGFISVLSALGGNIFITVIKFIGFFLTGSGALFSEAVHSIADVFNQVLLMVGIKRSMKKADHIFPYGYGYERFFWALISACSIFFLGAGITIYHGINLLIHGEHVEVQTVAFIILLVSFVIESATFFVALQELRRNNKGKALKKIICDGDPTTIAVLYEDGVAVLGVFIAFVSILLTALTQKTYWDAIGSILIGILLAVMAIILINRNRGYLIKKSIPLEMREAIIEQLESHPAIEKVLDFKSAVLDIGKYHVKCEVEFNGSALMRNMYRPNDLREEYEQLQNDYNEFVRFCAEYADRVPRMIGNTIDDIETKMKKDFPEVRHIDIEVN